MCPGRAGVGVGLVEEDDPRWTCRSRPDTEDVTVPVVGKSSIEAFGRGEKDVGRSLIERLPGQCHEVVPDDLPAGLTRESFDRFRRQAIFVPPDETSPARISA